MKKEPIFQVWDKTKTHTNPDTMTRRTTMTHKQTHDDIHRQTHTMEHKHTHSEDNAHKLTHDDKYTMAKTHVHARWQTHTHNQIHIPLRTQKHTPNLWKKRKILKKIILDLKQILHSVLLWGKFQFVTKDKILKILYNLSLSIPSKIYIITKFD